MIDQEAKEKDELTNRGARRGTRQILAPESTK